MTTLHHVIYGNSGRRYPFTLQSMFLPKPEYPGVYLVASSAPSPAGPALNLLYIGQAENMRQRHECHHRRNEFALLNASWFGWMTVGDEATRRWIESDLLALNRPPINNTPVLKRLFPAA